MNKTRPHSVAFRLSEEEATKLKNRIASSGLSSQEFLVRAVMNYPIIPKAELQNILLELRKQTLILSELQKTSEKEVAQKIEKNLEELEKLWQFLSS